MLKRIKKILLYTVTGIIILLILITGFTQTIFFKNFLRDKVEGQVNASIQGELRIGRIRGNLVNYLAIDDIVLASPGDTLFTMEELIVRFQPLKLLNRKISFRAIRILGPQISLVQWPDSTWNVTHLTPPGESKPDTSEQFKWTLKIKNAALRQAFISIRPLDPASPLAKKVTDINALLSMEFSSHGLDANVEDLQLAVGDTPFRIHKTSFSFAMSETLIQVADFDLKTEYSTLAGNLTFSMLKTGPVHAELRAQPLSQKDWRTFLPDLPETSIEPDINLIVTGQKDSLAVQLNVRTPEQQLEIDGYAAQLNSIPSYQLAICFSNIKPRDWVSTISSEQPVDGCIYLRGSGVTSETLDAEINANLRGLSYQNRTTDNILLDATLNNGTLDTRLHVAASMGSLDVDARIKQLFNQPTYQIEANGSGIDIASILQLEQASKIQFYCNVNGQGFDPATMQAHGDVLFYASDFADIPLDTLQVKIDANQQVYTVHKLQLLSPLVRAELSGTIKADSVSNARFHIQPGDLEYLSAWIENPPEVTGDILGTASGSFTRLNVHSQFHTNVRYQEISLDSLSGDINLNTGEETTSTFELAFRKGMVNTIPLDNFRFTGHFTPDSLNSKWSVVHHDTNSVFLNSHLSLDSVTTLTLNDLRWENGNKVWQLSYPKASVSKSPNFYRIDSLGLYYQDQQLLIDGFLQPQKEQYAHIKLENINLVHLTQWLNNTSMPTGTLQADVILNGTASEPVLNANVNLTDIKLRNYQLGNVHSTLRYHDALATLSFDLHRGADKLLTVYSSTSLPLSLETLDFNVSFEKPVIFQAEAQNLNLGFLKTFLPALDRFQGQLDFDLRSPDLLDMQHLTGEFSFKNGIVALHQTGVPYKDIRFQLNFNDKHITLKDFLIASGKGTLHMVGSANLSSRLSELDFESFQINVNTNRFTAVQTRDLELVLNSDLNLQGDLMQPTFSGKLNVVQSKINLTGLQGESPSREELDPLLLRDKKTIKDTIPSQKRTPPDVIKRLRGQTKISIPRNTWIRSKDMNIEISGDVDIIKQSDKFEFFGSIETVRGTYSFYGKRFIIQTGTITLQGGTRIDPSLNISADYRFRDADGNKRTLTLNITGTLSAPDISFALDDDPIEPQDGVSYIIFGRSTQQLSHSEKTQMSSANQSLNAAKMSGLLYGQIAKQLSSQLQRNLNLDVIEFTGDANWRSASVVIGKYITNDLFLRYEREFSFGQTEDIVPQKVSLEYEIARFLYLQAIKGDPKSTGFDLIFKFEEGK